VQWRKARLEAKGNVMVTYITLINFTEQGIRNVKDSANRASHYKDLAAKLGCTIKEIWWTQGQYDVVSIVDAPDDASATALAMSVGKLGYIRSKASAFMRSRAALGTGRSTARLNRCYRANVPCGVSKCARRAGPLPALISSSGAISSRPSGLRVSTASERLSLLRPAQ